MAAEKCVASRTQPFYRLRDRLWLTTRRTQRRDIASSLPALDDATYYSSFSKLTSTRGALNCADAGCLTRSFL
jgi:hypothetical protein